VSSQKKILLQKNQVTRIFGKEAEGMKVLRDRCVGVKIMSLKTFPEDFNTLKEQAIESSRRRQQNRREKKEEKEKMSLTPRMHFER